MPLVRPRPATPLRRRLVASLAGLLTLGSGLGLVAEPAQASNVATPGNFTGYGFDQCLAPSQTAMDAWLYSSPFWAVGIYISGDSRACPVQPNLTPTWVTTQLANGWRLLPITLGPQAWCTSRDRYRNEVRINPNPTSHYRVARAQGRAEAVKTVGAADGARHRPRQHALVRPRGRFRMDLTDCRESALSFLSAWTKKLHRLGFLSGFYSSAATGVRCWTTRRRCVRARTRCPTALGGPLERPAPTSRADLPSRAPAGRRTGACTSTAAVTTKPMAASRSTSTATTSTWAPGSTARNRKGDVRRCRRRPSGGTPPSGSGRPAIS